ncbi:MAG: hypothetical protein RIT81_30450 [Deltaproteobacteria bacterium]
MAALTFVGLLAPVYFIPPVFSALLPGQRLLGVVLSVASIVVLMTYAIMPALIRAGAAWFHFANYAKGDDGGLRSTEEVATLP